MFYSHLTLILAERGQDIILFLVLAAVVGKTNKGKHFLDEIEGQFLEKDCCTL